MFTIAIVKPDATAHLGEILACMTRGGLVIEEVRVLRFTRESAAALYADHAGKDWFGAHLDFMASGPVVALVMRLWVPDSAQCPIARLRELVGPTDPEVARREAPGSIRAKLGTTLPKNAIHASANQREAIRDRDVLNAVLSEYGEHGDFL